jgi:hypothetical protein
MIDATVQMDNSNFAPPCTMMNDWIVGAANTNQVITHAVLGQTPTQIHHEGTVYYLEYDDINQVVTLWYFGFDARGEEIRYNTRIQYVDMRRWVEQYHEHMRSH